MGQVVIVKFVVSAVVGLVTSKVVAGITGNETLGMIAGIVAGGMSANAVGASSTGAGATSGSATGAVGAGGAGSAGTVTAGIGESAMGIAGTGNLASDAAIGSLSSAPLGSEIAGQGMQAMTGAGDALAGAAANTAAQEGTKTGMLGNWLDSAKEYLASDKGHDLLAQTAVSGVQGYAQAASAAKEAEKERNFRARNDGAMGGDLSRFHLRPRQEEEPEPERRAQAATHNRRAPGLLSMYDEIYNRKPMEA